MKSSKLPTDLFVSARSKSNPYESVYQSNFKNTDAIKLANLDLLANLFPKDKSEKFTFLSVGKSSGFAEYLLFKNPNSKGFGLNIPEESIKDEKFANLSLELNANDLKDVSSRCQKILLETDSTGVDFVSALTDVYFLFNETHELDFRF